MEKDELALHRNHGVEDLTLVCPLRNLPLDAFLRLGESKSTVRQPCKTGWGTIEVKHGRGGTITSPT